MAFAAVCINVDEFNLKINLDNGKVPCSVIDIEIYHLLSGLWLENCLHFLETMSDKGFLLYFRNTVFFTVF